MMFQVLITFTFVFQAHSTSIFYKQNQQIIPAQLGFHHENSDKHSKKTFEKDNVPGSCPYFCICIRKGEMLSVINCAKDPANHLSSLLETNQNMTALTIYNSSLTTLPLQVCNMALLNSLHVSNNLLSDLPWPCLKKLKALTSISATHNRFETLRNGSFYDFPVLYTINFESNQISRIDVDVFLQHERISLINIRLNHNKLTRLDIWPLKYIFKPSVHISLAYNQISQFSNLQNWTFSCKPNRKFNHIDLAFNNISHINDMAKGWNVHWDIYHICLLFSVKWELRGNPFVCDCVDFLPYTFMKQSRYSSLSAQLHCSEPETLYGRRIASVPLDDFVCHVTEKCPVDCSCIDQPNKLNMSINCEGLSKTNLPAGLPKCPKRNYKYNLNFKYNDITNVVFYPYFNRAQNVILSNNNISDISIDVLKALTKAESLHLDNNKLKYLPKNISLVNMSLVKDILLSKNEWVCDCKIKETRNWMLQTQHLISDSEGLLCKEPPRLKGSNLLSLTEHELICGNPPDKELSAYLGAGGTAFGIGILFVALGLILKYKRIWLYKRFNWHPFDIDECEGENKEFDIFVAYCNNDEDYVEDYLIPNLQNRGYKIAFHRVNFPGGQPITLSIEQCIRNSKRTLAVFSNNFNDSTWCMWEFTVALELDGNEGTHRLLAIKFEDVDMTFLNLTLQSYFKRYTYIERNSANFWEALEYTLPKNKMGAVGDQVYDVQQPDGIPLEGDQDDIGEVDMIHLL